MKIKLITFAPHPNFGTCLQSYALNCVLRAMGHDVEFIHNERETPPPTFIQRVKMVVKLFVPNFILKSRRKRKLQNERNKELKKYPNILALPDHRMLYLISKMPGYEKIYRKIKCTSRQWEKVYKFTYEDGNFKMRRIYTHKQYEEVVADTDIFVTGSDQIWNPFCGGFNPMMFVEFGGNVKRIAYSSSIAQSEFPKVVEQRVKTDLSKFIHIGVREKSSVQLLNNLLGRTDVRLVVDPTYLLPTEEWILFGEKAEIEFQLPERYIFCYFVGSKRREVYERMVQEVKCFTGINDVITLECCNRPLNYGGMLYNDAGPYEWVYLLQHSSYVCMDSFHATVFALKFKKDFVHAMKNTDTEIGSQNARMYDILNRYGLSYKVYEPSSLSEWQRAVDYSAVTPIIEEEIKDSLAFLKYEIEN